jgi:hypothetical protein
MIFVEVRLNSFDLLSHLADMRSWLDRNGIDTTGFSYREQIDRMLARVAFKTAAGAEAFAARFAGRVVSDTASAPPPDGQPAIAALASE